MAKSLNLIAFILFLLWPSLSTAAPKWSNISLSYLHGSDYEIGDEDREVYTLEVASGFSWGDSFIFVDRLKADDGTDETYSEVGIRYSLFSLFNKKFEGSLLKDIKLAGQWESSALSSQGFSNSFDNYLYGVGFDWKAANFKYLNTNFYLRDNDKKPDNEQLTIVWGLPLAFGKHEFLIDGFWDITTKISSGSKWSSNLTPQIKYDLGHQLWGDKGVLYVGIEYVYWVNKFNISGVDERNINALIKWHL